MIPLGALGDLTPYLAGQYVRALKMRRLAHQLGALWTGKMPQASCYTPGCVTTKPYNPNPNGADQALVVKVHEILYAGPGVQRSNITDHINGVTNRNHPLNGTPITLNNPHPESLLGFIGKPANFWQWAAAGYNPAHLPAWAAAGVPGAGGAWKEYTGTYLFDAVAAAHIFPEYFWLGSVYGRFLAWGIFEGGKADGISIMNFADQRLITRKRVHIPQNPNGSGTLYSYTARSADHRQIKEYLKYGWYNEVPPNNVNTFGRHPWDGLTEPNPNKGGAYTFAKAPRYLWSAAEGGPNDYVPYEVGPLARAMANASGLSTPGGPATALEVTAVNNGQAYAYYPGILAHVDTVLGGLLGIVGGKIGVFQPWGANLANTLAWAVGAGVYYLPPGAISGVLLQNPPLPSYHSDYMGDGVLDRVAARALETYFVGMQMLSWFNKLNPANPSNKTLHFTWGSRTDRTAPKRSKGAGLTEAPRGALGHWIKIGKPQTSPKYLKFRGKVNNYQIITPTAWNISPKDHNNQMGPGERAVWGTPLVDETEPIEILRVIHSFDYCCACTVHVMNADKEKVFEGRLDPLP
jgi:Ni,Fe-hydrogenase I large subunit